MANELKLNYTRFTRTASSTSKAIVQWKTTMQETLEQLKIAPWVEAISSLSDITMPVNSPLTFAVSDSYDTYKMSTTAAGTGMQRCHMGMVAYRYKIPTDATTNHKYPTQVLLSLGADKFNSSGLRVAVYLSNTATPPTSWTTCREGTEYIPDETIDNVTLGILASRTLKVSSAINAIGNYTVAFDPAISADYTYLYIIVSNYNYADYRTSREYYIEGSGILDGANVQVGFASAVTPDSPSAPTNGVYVPTTSTTMSTANGTGMTQANAVLTVMNMLALYPGAYNTMNDASADVAIGGYTTNVSTTYYANLGGFLTRMFIKTRTNAFKSLSFGSGFSIDLSSQPFSVMCNLWVGTPITSSGDYADYTSIAATNTPGAFAQLAYGTGTVQIEVVLAGLTAPTISFKNVGQFILEKGKAYTTASLFPINLTKNEGPILSGLLFMTPLDQSSVSNTTKVTMPLDCAIYLY